MGWFILSQVFSILIAIVSIGRLSEQEKDLEILVLRQQLAILQRKQGKPIKPSRAEKMMLAVLTAKLKDVTQQAASRLRDIIRIFQPETVLGWHRQLVRRKWSYERKNKGGRPGIDQELENLILRLARENSRWGYGKIEGELIKLGFQVSRTTIRNVLDRHNIKPAPVRNGSIGWHYLMTHYKEQILACDFFTVETIRLQTIYVLFFIELGSRRVHLAGVAAHPNKIWVTQQARQIVWELDDRKLPMHFLIRDNDRKFSRSFDTVFRSEGFHVIPTPFQAPNANAFAERWVRTIREECLDHILILNETHLQRVLGEFIDDYYNVARPHQGIEQPIPIPHGQPLNTGSVQRRKVLGGIINDYCRNPVVSSSHSIH
jgi:putative transposase